MTAVIPSHSARWSRLLQMVAAVSLLASGGAWAQPAFSSSKADAARAEWRRLSQKEINCVDHSLRAQRSSVWHLIQRGTEPSDAAVAALRAACRTQAPAQAHAQAKPKTQAQTPTPTAHTAMAAAVEKAPSREYWTYEGSLLISVADGASRKFHYLPPGQLTTADGAGLGAVIFEGKVSNNKYAGIAYSIDSQCGRMPYRVAGTVTDKPRGIELTGQKPRLDKNCKVTGTDADTMTFELIDPAIAAAGDTVSGQESASKAASEKLAAASDKEQAAANKAAAPQPVAEKAAADKAVVAKVVTEKAAAEKAVADKMAAEKAVVEKAAAKAAADKAAADKAAVEKAAAEQAAADSAAAEKAAAEKAAAEKAAAEKAAADKVTAEIVAAAKLAKEKITTDKPVTEQTALAMARAEADRAQADAERARKEAEKVIADAGLALASAESRLSFIYGFISALALLGLAGAAFLVMQKMKERGWLPAKNAAPEPARRETQAEFDRLLAAVLDEQKRRESKPLKPDAPARKPRVQEPAPV